MTRIGALKPVIRVEVEGAREYLALSCGHRKLRNTKVAVPTRAYCETCEREDDA